MADLTPEPRPPIIRGESEAVGRDESMWWMLWMPLAALALAGAITGVICWLT